MDRLTLAQTFAVWALPVIFAITLHEVSHGWVALKLGDTTAKMLGRLTINPIKHIDIVGTIIVPAILLFVGGFIFGWAKPVPVNYNNLKNPRRDMALVAAAGPVSNLLMAIFWAGIIKVGIILMQHHAQAGPWLAYTGQAGLMINLILMTLNLIPIPPLDGSRVIESFLPPSLAIGYSKLEPYGFFILLGLLYFGILGMFILPPVVYVRGIILTVFGLGV